MKPESAQRARWQGVAQFMSLWAVAVLLGGCATPPQQPDSPRVMSANGREEVVVGRHAVYCKLGDEAWHRVLRHDETGVTALADAVRFTDVWNQDRRIDEVAANKTIRRAWHELLVPLPESPPLCWAYGLTYPEHRKESGVQESLRFRKVTPAQGMFTPIAHRSNLDYEAEIGILAHRDRSDRFGYVMVNDLTDRGMQVMEYDKSDPGPGFSRAKSFEGALRIGPLLVVADENLWDELEITLRLNGEIRQSVRGKDCLMRPRQFREEVLMEEQDEAWVLVATGTSAGVVFGLPSFGQKLWLFTRSGFSMDRAKDRWLSQLPFLQSGDELELWSPLLGTGRSEVRYAE